MLTVIMDVKKDGDSLSNRLPLLCKTAGDTLTLCVGYGSNYSESGDLTPIFAHRPVSWSVTSAQPENRGLTHVFELSHAGAKREVSKNVKNAPPTDKHQWGVFIFNNNNPTSPVAKDFGAYVVDLDWTEQLAQLVVEQRLKAHSEALSQGSFMTRAADRVLRRLKGTRTLKLEFDLKTLIRSGHAFKAKGVPNKDVTHTLLDTITFTRHHSEGRFVMGPKKKTALMELIEETLASNNDTEQTQSGSKTETLVEEENKSAAESTKAGGPSELTEGLDERLPQKALAAAMDDTADSSDTDVSSLDTESSFSSSDDDGRFGRRLTDRISDDPSHVAKHLRKARLAGKRGDRLFKILGEEYFHFPLKGRSVGTVTYEGSGENDFDLIAMKALEADRLETYKESGKERAIWCTMEVLCATVVNIVFALL
eukprot:Blabericola_migrator_1__7150@NODE_3622_length_1627_cov_8_352564_g2244_i0_p1_GENE_NODE_3622_length_1627_cov_8_352564_g2244_i0NODE_3622_length_1627_cov_8_352564_g2244_i0_p1_ORF_typecomplete_len424_score86_52Dehydrin/PF00257_19/0_86Dehydrin/PF00257_19/1_3e02_NODE_3622_length_1627_cov_8_352564_g2244_i01991470